jgi:hypothetical protein
MVECNWFLLLDGVLEMADVLRVYNLDRKNTIRFIANNPTVEAQLAVNRTEGGCAIRSDPLGSSKDGGRRP